MVTYVADNLHVMRVALCHRQQGEQLCSLHSLAMEQS